MRGYVRIKGGKLKPYKDGKRDIPLQPRWQFNALAALRRHGEHGTLRRRIHAAARQRHARSPRAKREWSKRNPARDG